MIYKRGNHWHMDAVVSGVRYREALKTTDRREAPSLEKKRVSEIHQGKGASQAGREFARKPFNAAADQFLEDRKPHVSERTHQLERERLKPLRAFFGEKPVLRIKAEDVAAFQRHRRGQVAGRTVNMEVGVLRQMMKRGKRWNVVAEDVTLDRENATPIARVLTPEQKRTLFETAASKPDWMVTHCAAVLAVSTTCRGVELKNLHWRDVDLFERVLTVRRSKTEAGCRTIPLNGDGVAALSRLWERAQLNEATAPEHYVFPTCEHGISDPTKPQKSFRTTWRNIARETARRAGREAARAVLQSGGRIGVARAAWKRAAQAFRGFRFHDLRHQAVTELAEGGASDATMMAVAGHMSRRMLEHYSHVRMARKREALDKLSSGLMGPGAKAEKPASEAIN